MADDNNKRNAYKHSLFNLLNTLWLGVTKAKELGDAHEDKPGNVAIFKEMDLWKNRVE